MPYICVSSILTYEASTIGGVSYGEIVDGYEAHLSSLVLCDFVLCVLFAGLALAVCAASLRNVDLEDIKC